MSPEEQRQHQEQIITQAEYQNLCNAVSVIMSQKPGKTFVKYLFDAFGVVEVWPEGIHGDFLLEMTSFRRAGQSIYALCLDAAPELTGQVVAELIKETKEKKNASEAQAKNESGE